MTNQCKLHKIRVSFSIKEWEEEVDEEEEEEIHIISTNKIRFKLNQNNNLNQLRKIYLNLYKEMLGLEHNHYMSKNKSRINKVKIFLLMLKIVQTQIKECQINIIIKGHLQNLIRTKIKSHTNNLMEVKKNSSSQ